ncbi:hypothetical protein MA16_Dca003843 [Dendrobium catenatum]|uniref:Serine/threonine-protein phosphatase 7 long form like n=1 Tax=Dendrobium catenatum TaxID=906689 RepID=A0A2I0X1R6_9ASPA|nr:hypothetical protein MA16_Dca003843 [Dendrobium catenatum]
MDPSFRRIDGRGRADQDWTVQYRDYLQIWEDRRAYVVPITPVTGTGNREVGAYLRWYRSWASIYLLQPQIEPPETFFPRSPSERLVADYYIRSSAILEPLAGGGGQNASSLQMAIDQVAELSARVQQSVYIDYTTFDTSTEVEQQRREHTETSHGQQHSRRSVLDAPVRSMGSRHRRNVVPDPHRHSVHTPSMAYDYMGAGTSAPHWSPHVRQSTQPGQIYYDRQYDQTSGQSLFPMAIPHWMSSVGLPSSPAQQDIMLTGGYPTEPGTQLSQQRVEVEQEETEVLEEPQL